MNLKTAHQKWSSLKNRKKDEEKWAELRALWDTVEHMSAPGILDPVGIPEEQRKRQKDKYYWPEKSPVLWTTFIFIS